jgi:type I restriction enzyme S subunit
MTQALPKDVPQTLRRWKRYSAYNDSGIEELGEVPTHWKITKLRWYLSLRSGDYISNTDFDIEADDSKSFPVIGGNGVAGFSALYNVCQPTIAIGRVGALCGNIHLINENSWVTDNALLITNWREFEREYLGLLLTVMNLNKQASQNAQPLITGSLVKNQIAALPPVTEQKAIASFLDRETAKIDALIAKKERLIELLQEKRTAIINHAVTKGLDPTMPLEDSGVDWLGEVPAHWKVLSVRRLAGVIEQGWSPVAEDRLSSEDEWGVIKLSAVSQGLFRPEEHKTLPENMEADQRYEIKAGDFLVTRANTPNLVGDVCVVSNTRPHLMLSDLVYRVFVDDNRVSRKYLCYWFLCRAGRYQIKRDARGSSLSMVKVSQNSIRSWLVALPPFLEQQAIASYLDREIAKIDALIAKIREGIEKLKEYRTALISSAVTGKIDVRELTD